MKRELFLNAQYNTKQDSIGIGWTPQGARSFAEAPDVIAHEYGHRMMHVLAPAYRYTKASAAVGESVADTFAALTDGNWRLGEGAGTLRDAANGISFGATTSYRTDMGHFVANSDGHLNSTIATRAAFLTAKALGNYVTGFIYTEALMKDFPAEPDIAALGRAVRDAAARVGGSKNPGMGELITLIWKKIGVTL
jgi:Zn-dependent metalloprotease